MNTTDTPHGAGSGPGDLMHKASPAQVEAALGEFTNVHLNVIRTMKHIFGAEVGDSVDVLLEQAADQFSQAVADAVVAADEQADSPAELRAATHWRRYRQVEAERDALRAEVERLRQWKAEATEVISGLQDLGKALGLFLGERITGPTAVEAARSLRERAEAGEAKVAAGLALADEYERRAEAADRNRRRSAQRYKAAAIRLRAALSGPSESTEASKFERHPDVDYRALSENAPHQSEPAEVPDLLGALIRSIDAAREHRRIDLHEPGVRAAGSDCGCGHSWAAHSYLRTGCDLCGCPYGGATTVGRAKRPTEGEEGAR